MRRTLFGGLIVATLALPGAAFATQARGMNINPQTMQSLQNSPTTTDLRIKNNLIPANASPRGSIGAGQMGNDVPAHNDAPGATKIDNDSRAPVNDIQVGRGTTDVPQSHNPPPARY